MQVLHKRTSSLGFMAYSDFSEFTRHAHNLILIMSTTHTRAADNITARSPKQSALCTSDAWAFARARQSLAKLSINTTESVDTDYTAE